MNPLKRYLFYSRYAFRDFRRSGSRAVFATFCVAAGVAAIVALQLVSADLRAAITGNAQQATRGDVAATAPARGMPLADYRKFATLQRHHEIVGYTPVVETIMTMRPLGGDATAVDMGVVQGIDPAVYPYYDHISAIKPSGVPLARLLADPQNIVVNQAIYDKLKLHIGSRVLVNIRAHRLTYTVAGIIPSTAGLYIANPFVFSDLTLANYRTFQKFTISEGNAASRVLVKTQDAAQASHVKQQLKTSLGPVYTVNTAADVEKQNKDAMAGLDKFMNMMGLLAVLIGGIGIVNTMYVAVRRRRKDIAIVKALGMKQGQVVGTFSIGAVALGLSGGILGIAAGILASRGVNQVTQDLMPNTALEWRIRPAPLLIGMAVAIVGTVLFAFFPVNRESRIRPVAALRDDPSGPVLTRRGRIAARARNVGTIALLAVIGGVLAAFLLDFGSAVSNAVAGALIGMGVLLVLGLLTEFFSWVVVGIGKLPALHRLTLRLAFRSLERQKRRMASTLLALCVGILSVGTVTIMAQDLKADIQTATARDNSFNAIIYYGLAPSDMARVRAAVNNLPGVIKREFAGVNDRAQMISVDGRSARLVQADALTTPSKADQYRVATQYMRSIAGRDLQASGTLTTRLTAGRPLGPQDAGTDHAMVGGLLAQALGIRVGSILDYRVGSQVESFEVVAIASPNAVMFTGNGLTADVGYLRAFGGLSSSDSENYSTTYLTIQDKYVSQDVAALNRALPRSTVLDLSAIVSLINTWIDKFALFPQILAALSLFAGAVIIANAVAMTMMERRREIGIMKAVGAKRRFVLQELLTENGIVGLVGALSGTILAVGATAVVDKALLNITASFNPLVILGLLALGTGLTVVAALLTAWPASGEKPFTVLRYE